VATPCLDGNLTIEYVASLMLTQQLCQQHGISLDLSVLRGDCFIAKARNNLVMQFLDTSNENLFFIDADEGWDPYGFVRMVLDKHEIVAAAVPKKSDDLEFNGIDLDLLPNGDCIIENSLLRAHRIGTGFMRIKRSAIEKLIKEYPTKYRPGDGSQYSQIYALFETEIIDGQFWGEDLAFCQKWRKLGEHIWLDTQVDFSHVGRKSYKGNYFKFMQANCKMETNAVPVVRPQLKIVQDFKEADVGKGEGGMWLLATRRRVPLVRRFLEAAVSTGMQMPGVILVNEKELEELKVEYDALALPKGWSILGVKADSLCETMREVLPLYEDLDWVGTVTDDVVPETQDWEQKLLMHHDRRAIISCNDGKLAPRRMCGAIIWPVDLFRVVGYWVPSGFLHCFVDDIWEITGRDANCWRVNMDVTVRHLHPWVTGQEDETHRHSYRADKWANDQALFEEWKIYAKTLAVSKLRLYLSHVVKEAA